MAALRLLLRRRLAAPRSLELLHPLLPVPYSKAPTPLLAAAAAATADAGLLGVRRAQLSPYPALSLLRLYSSKACSPPPRKQRTCRVETVRLNQGEKCGRTVANTEIQYHTQESVSGIIDDVMKLSQLLTEAMEAFKKAYQLIVEGCDDDRAFVVVEKALDNVFKALALYEKGLQKLATAIESSNGLPPDFQEKNLVSVKAMLDGCQTMRQNLEKLSSSIETRKTRKKLAEGEFRSFAENLNFLKKLTNSLENLKTLKKLNKGIIAVGLGSCLLLAVLMIGIYLA